VQCASLLLPTDESAVPADIEPVFQHIKSHAQCNSLLQLVTQLSWAVFTINVTNIFIHIHFDENLYFTLEGSSI